MDCSPSLMVVGAVIWRNCCSCSSWESTAVFVLLLVLLCAYGNSCLLHEDVVSNAIWIIRTQDPRNVTVRDIILIWIQQSIMKFLTNPSFIYFVLHTCSSSHAAHVQHWSWTETHTHSSLQQCFDSAVHSVAGVSRLYYSTPSIFVPTENTFG